MSKLSRLLRFVTSKQSLSESLSWGIDRNWGKMRPEYSIRNDVQRLPISDGVELEVYWKKLKLGKGPACSLFMLEEEILRIDCFGKGAGHMHIALFLPGNGEHRLWMCEATIEEQVARARFELYRNYKYYQCRVPNPKIRALSIDRQRMREVSDEAYGIMSGYIDSTLEVEIDYGEEAYSDQVD